MGLGKILGTVATGTAIGIAVAMKKAQDEKNKKFCPKCGHIMTKHSGRRFFTRCSEIGCFCSGQ